MPLHSVDSPPLEVWLRADPHPDPHSVPETLAPASYKLHKDAQQLSSSSRSPGVARELMRVQLLKALWLRLPRCCRLGKRERRAPRRRGRTTSRQSAASCCCCSCSSAHVRDSARRWLDDALRELSWSQAASAVDGGELRHKNQLVRRPKPFCRAERPSPAARSGRHRRQRQQRLARHGRVF